jgi:hypothetical protein
MLHVRASADVPQEPAAQDRPGEDGELSKYNWSQRFGISVWIFLNHKEKCCMLRTPFQTTKMDTNIFKIPINNLKEYVKFIPLL